MDIRAPPTSPPLTIDEIGFARIAGTDAALQAHLGRATLPGLARTLADLIELKIVGLLARFRSCAGPLEKAQNLQPYVQMLV